MEHRPFEAKVSHDDGTATVALEGDIDGSVQPAMLDVSAATAGAERIVLDFGDVEYINSTGIALIVGLLSRARVAGQPVSAIGLSAHYRHIFEITRLADFMAIRDEPSPTTVGPTATATQ